MKFSSGLALLVVSALILSSCASKKVATKNVVMDTLKISASAPVNIFRETRPRIWDISHTDAALTFNLKEKTADGEASVRLHPYAYPQRELRLDAKSMTVREVLLGGKSKVRFEQRKDSLFIDLAKTYQTYDTVELVIRYTAMPYASPTGGSKAIADDRGLYFINGDGTIPGKPVQIWTQGETESNSHWLPTLDQPNERFTFSLTLTVPDSFTTLSNGVFISGRNAGNGLRRDVWEIRQPIQPYAIMFAIGKFNVVFDRGWNGKEVSYYVEPEYAPYARQMFAPTPDMIEYFSRVTGVPYPWEKYSQIVVRDYVSGAMENTSASLFGEFMNKNDRQLKDDNDDGTIAHELFHQWFGDYVTAESWSNLTLSESFASYGEQLWQMHRHGADSRDELALNDLNRYLSATRFDDPPLLRFYYDDKEDMFDRISYQKGAAILRYMHGLAGDSAFFRAMKIYLTKNALQPAEASDWRKAVEEATGQDWQQFFGQWYLRGGHPVLDVKHNYDDGAQILTVTTTQIGNDSSFAYRLPLKASLITERGITEKDWLVSKTNSTAVFPYEEGMRPLFIPDSRHWLPGTIKENNTAQEWLVQLKLAKDYISKDRALDGLNAGKNDTLLRAGLLLALKDSNTTIRTTALGWLQRKSGKDWTDPFTDPIRTLAVADRNNDVRASALDVLGKWKIVAVSEQITGSVWDSSYKVSGSALRALARMDSTAALRAARAVVTMQPRGRQYEAVWEILSNAGNGADIDAMEREALRLYGTRKVSFASNLKRFAQRTTDASAFSRAVLAIADMTKREPIRHYRVATGSNLFQLASIYANDNSIGGRERVQLLNTLKAEIPCR